MDEEIAAKIKELIFDALSGAMVGDRDCIIKALEEIMEMVEINNA